jgi:hypothetical protein
VSRFECVMIVDLSCIMDRREIFNVNLGCDGLFGRFFSFKKKKKKLKWLNSNTRSIKTILYFRVSKAKEEIVGNLH